MRWKRNQPQPKDAFEQPGLYPEVPPRFDRIEGYIPENRWMHAHWRTPIDELFPNTSFSDLVFRVCVMILENGGDYWSMSTDVWDAILLDKVLRGDLRYTYPDKRYPGECGMLYGVRLIVGDWHGFV